MQIRMGRFLFSRLCHVEPMDRSSLKNLLIDRTQPVEARVDAAHKLSQECRDAFNMKVGWAMLARSAVFGGSVRPSALTVLRGGSIGGGRVLGGEPLGPQHHRHDANNFPKVGVGYDGLPQPSSIGFGSKAGLIQGSVDRSPRWGDCRHSGSRLLAVKVWAFAKTSREDSAIM